MDEATTIIYYTANTENVLFEEKVKQTIIKNSNGLPIISVSRKPTDFGNNICVGEIPVCYANGIRQLLLGLKLCKTKYAIAAESDCLYPPEYFSHVPLYDNRMYRYRNVKVIYQWESKKFKGKFWEKAFTEGAQMAGVEYWINSIENQVDGGDWKNTKNPPIIFERHLIPRYSWNSVNPVITIKTKSNISKYTTKTGISFDTVPYWGSEKEIQEWLS
jgi:hypothetical protein